MKYGSFTLVFILWLICPFQSEAQNPKMEMFALNQVRLLKSPFLAAQKTDLEYMLKLEPDRLLAPFLREAGLQPKAKSYGNWENSGLDGHTAGHYLTALAQMYATSGNQECQSRLNYMINELARCQDKNGNGYVGGVPDGNRMWAFFKEGDFAEFNKKWVPWYNMHKLLAGLRDSYLLAGNIRAKDMFVKLIDWVADEVSGLSDQQMEQMLGTEHGGMNEVCADAAAITGDKKYLLLAKKFSHKRLLIPMEKHQDNLTGLHANTQIPKVIGFERIAELSGDTAYASAAKYFWQNVVNKRTISIGGNSVREHFNPADDFTSMIETEQGPETCNSNNMLKLSKMLFLDEHQARYINFYERLLYNHILSSQRPGTGGFVYFTPIHPQHYRVYSTADQSFWCCVGTGMENHGKYAELIYTHSAKNLYVNLFIPSTLSWKEKGIWLEQHTTFPESEHTELVFKLNKPSRFTLWLRKPDWIKNNGFIIRINHQVTRTVTSKDGYIGIERTWNTGDNIIVELPMKNYVEYLPDNSAWVSFLHGPVVLAAATDSTNLNGLNADDSRWGHIAGGPLYALAKSPLLIGDRASLITAMHSVNKAGTEFELSKAIWQNQFKNLKLKPFYEIHDTRYMLYWPVSARDSVSQKESELQMLDNTYIKLAAKTVDWVAPGEQQPENDHGLKTEQSETGLFRNLHWRSAAGYFSYNMRTSAAAKKLSLTYYGREKNREFDIYLDDKKITHVVLDGSGPDAFFSAEYPLPQEINTNGKRVTLKFVATAGHQTASIYDVRILR